MQAIIESKVGSPEWLENVKAIIRDRHGLKSDQDVRLTSVAADFGEDGSDDGAFTARITHNISDRDKEVILPGGGDFSDFDRSGIVAWNHDYDRPVAIPGKISKDSESVYCRARWFERPEDWEGEWHPDFARSFVQQMRSAGKAAGVSIGFIPTEARRPSKKDVELYGDDVENVITRWKLLEWSIAPVQANPEAYVTAVGKSLGSAACKALFGVEPPREPVKRAAKIYFFSDPPKPEPKRKRWSSSEIASLVRDEIKRCEAKNRGLITA